MADIYQDAFITLAATSSSDATRGCFSLNHKSSREYILASDASIGVREKLKHWTKLHPKASKELYPLLSRGWVFQERYLSPRVVHFCTQELVWECKEEVICECGNISTATDSRERLVIDDDASVPFKKTRSSPGQERVDKKCHTIVEQYSALKLTKTTDRLPALSGLAERVSLRHGPYLCGLWYDTLLSDMLWRVPLLDDGCVRPDQYTGPSWSWASVTGPVKYWQDLGSDPEQRETMDRLLSYSRTLATTAERDEAKRKGYRLGRLINALELKANGLKLKCNVEPAGKNPLGEVSSGVLQMEGHLKSATLQYVDSASESSRVMQYQLTIHGTEIDSNLELSFFPDYILSEGPDRIPPGTQLFPLLVHTYTCMVLKPKGDGSTFERVGILRPPSGLILHYELDWMKDSKQN